MLGSYENVQPLVQISRTVPWFIYKIFVNVCTIFGVRYQALKLEFVVVYEVQLIITAKITFLKNAFIIFMINYFKQYNVDYLGVR